MAVLGQKIAQGIAQIAVGQRIAPAGQVVLLQPGERGRVRLDQVGHGQDGGRNVVLDQPVHVTERAVDRRQIGRKGEARLCQVEQRIVTEHGVPARAQVDHEAVEADPLDLFHDLEDFGLGPLGLPGFAQPVLGLDCDAVQLAGQRIDLVVDLALRAAELHATQKARLFPVGHGVRLTVDQQRGRLHRRVGRLQLRRQRQVLIDAALVLAQHTGPWLWLEAETVVEIVPGAAHDFRQHAEAEGRQRAGCERLNRHTAPHRGALGGQGLNRIGIQRRSSQ